VSYTSILAVKRELGITADTDNDIIGDKIQAAEKEIDRFCGRHFEAVTATRYYREGYEGFAPDGDVLLLDDDLLTVTTLTNGNGSVIPSTGYWLEPRATPPYYLIRLKSAYTWTFVTDGEVSVAGTWGKTQTAPDDIAEIARELALYLYRLKDVSNLTATTLPDGGDTPIPVDLPKHVKAALSSYRSLV
jgi:gp6-like head-tail connector protein